MSSDYYLHKWKQILIRLKNITSVDIEFQKTKAHERKLCETVVRLTGVLAEYIATCKEASECSQQNLQVQKTEFMNEIIESVESRILELKHQIRKLETSNYQFLSHGLIDHKLTTNDIEMSDLFIHVNRPPHMQALLEDVIHKVDERKIELERKAKEEEEREQMQTDETALQHHWWNDDSNTTSKSSLNKIKTIYDVQVVISKETLKRRELIALIQAHEKTRQVTLENIKAKQKRIIWTKELQGTLNPPARYEIREKSAKMIQKVLRVYLEIKRRKIQNYKRDQILGINIDYQKFDTNSQKISNQVKPIRQQLKKIYVNEWKIKCEKIKEIYLKKRGDDIRDDYRTYLTYWFKQWYEEAHFFNDIPKANVDGSCLIIKEEVPTPSEWLQQYEKYLYEKNANKNKSPLQLKWESMEAEKENKKLKKEEIKQKKLKDMLKKKMMKNPNFHPGYNYPESKKTENIVQAIDKYQYIWNDLDKEEEIAAKEGFIKEIDDENICYEVKMEVIKSVDDEKRLELKVLKKALKNDYKRSNEIMPTMTMQQAHRKKKKHKMKATASENVTEKLEDLAMKGFLKKYPKRSLQEFTGDHNFAGDDIRCSFEYASPLAGETRQLWWEHCREVRRGHHKILLVGPPGSGKSSLVHILASLNDAVLFELNPEYLQTEFLSVPYLQQLVGSVASCAKALQPSVVYIRHVERLYSMKKLKDAIDYNLVKRFFIRKLLHRIHKTDKVTIIGACTNPWTAKSSKMLKQFQTVILLPNTNYTTVSKLLQDWVLRYRQIPHNFNVQSLAHMLQGYSYRFLKTNLDEFMNSERIVKIAAHGVKPQEVYEYFLEKDDDSQFDYEKYLKWYLEKTTFGKKEQNMLKEQKAFQELIHKWQKQNKKTDPSSSDSLTSHRK